MQFLLLPGTSAADERKSVCNRARHPKRSFLRLSGARDFVECGTVVDLPFRLPSPAIATARARLLPCGDPARRLLRFAKLHPRCARAERRPTRLLARRIV